MHPPSMRLSIRTRSAVWAIATACALLTLAASAPAAGPDRRAIDSARGSSVFGTWTVDGHGLPAYDYTLDQNVDPRADRVPMPPKWKYVYAFDKTLRRKLEALAQPYPRGRSDTSDTPGDQPGEGEAASTRPLHPTLP